MGIAKTALHINSKASKMLKFTLILLNSSITTECPRNLLDNSAVMGSKVMYKHWCQLLDTPYCGYCIENIPYDIKAKLAYKCTFDGPTKTEPYACHTYLDYQHGNCQNCELINGETYKYFSDGHTEIIPE